MDNQRMTSCMDACKLSIEASNACARENRIKFGMEKSVKLCIACSDACQALMTANKTGTSLEVYVKRCEDACVDCAKECERHSEMKHCQECADACLNTAAECKALLRVAA